MADSQVPSPRVRWLAVPAAVIAAGGAFLLWRRAQKSPVVQPMAVVEVVPQTVAKAAPVQQVSPQKTQSPVRWLLYLGVAMFCVGLLVVLQSEAPEFAAALFTLLITGSIIYGVFRSADQIGEMILGARRAVGYPRVILQRYAGGLSVLIAGSAVVMAFLSAVLFWDSHAYRDLRVEAVKLFVGSVVAIWVALVLRPNTLPMMEIVLSRDDDSPRVSGFKSSVGLFVRRFGTRSALFMGLLLLLIDSEINGQFIKSDLLMLASVHVQFILLVAGTILVVIGLTGVRAAVVQPAQTWRERWQPLWPLGLITLLAFVLRFWHLDLAMRFLVDEGSFIGGIYGIKDYSFAGLLQPFSSISAFPYVFPYFQFLGIKLFGMGLIGVRVPSAIFGTLTVVALYFLARTLYDRKTAILAALFLATFPPHLQFSRIGINNIADPFFGTLALAFLMSGFRTRRRSDFVLAGVMLGFTQYFYEGGRLMFIPLGLVTLVGGILFAQISNPPKLLSPWGRVWLRVRWSYRNALLMLIALVIIAFPIYLTLAGLQRPALARFANNGLGLGASYWQTILSETDGFQQHIINHVLPAIGMYFDQFDSTFFYSRTTSLFLTGMLPVAMLGFAFVCYYWRKSGSILLLLWVIGAALGNSVMKDSTSSTRFVIVFPALALLAAVGLRYIVPIVIPSSRWQLVAIGGIGILLALYQTNFFFNQHLPEYNSIFRSSSPGPDGYDAAWRSIHFPAQTDIHLISTPRFNPIETVGLILAYRSDMHIDSIVSRLLSPRYMKKLTCGINHAFFVQKKDSKTIMLLQRYFKLDPPQFTPFSDVEPLERFVLYFAPYNPNDGSLYSHYCVRAGTSS